MKNERYEVESAMPMTKALLAKARKVNAERDAIDSGYPAKTADLDLASQLRLVMSALIAGMDTFDWSCVAEGCAMLQDAEVSIRPDYQQTN